MRIVLNNTSVIPFKWRKKLICFYCGDNFTEYVDFRNHTLSHGKCTARCYAMSNLNGHRDVKIDTSFLICEQCTAEFKNLQALIDHLTQEHDLKYDKDVDLNLRQFRLLDNQCLQCDDRMSTLRNLMKHINDVHTEKCYECNYCEKKFSKKTVMQFHLKNRHSEGHLCQICGLKFENPWQLLDHRVSCHIIGCPMCGAKQKTWKEMRSHIQKHHSFDTSKKCFYCQKDFHSVMGLKIHLMQCKMNLVLSKDSFEIEEKPCNKRNRQEIMTIRRNIQLVLNMSTAVPFKFRAKFSCFYCSKNFDEFSDLTVHTRSTHPVSDLDMNSFKYIKGEKTAIRVDIASLTCKICNIPITELEEFVNHAIAEHNADYDKSIDIKTCFNPYRVIKYNIPCPECGETFTYFGTMLRHYNSVHSTNGKICDYCGRGFGNTCSLRIHMKNNHTGQCQCEPCGLKFQNSAALSRHIEKRHDIKSYKCPRCPEMFRTRYHSQKHLIDVHNEGHKCDVCGKLFTKNSFMRAHVRRTHMKERTVPCSVCNQKFFDNVMLRLHMVKHDGERKYKCSQCGKAFLRSKNLRSHMDTHKKY